MKRAYVGIKLLYRKWIRIKAPTTTEFILLVAVAAAIAIKFKPVIEQKLLEHKNQHIMIITSNK